MSGLCVSELRRKLLDKAMSEKFLVGDHGSGKFKNLERGDDWEGVLEILGLFANGIARTNLLHDVGITQHIVKADIAQLMLEGF